MTEEESLIDMIDIIPAGHVVVPVFLEKYDVVKNTTVNGYMVINTHHITGYFQDKGCINVSLSNGSVIVNMLMRDFITLIGYAQEDIRDSNVTSLGYN